MMDVAILGAASFVAGIVDAMVGGGGLIQIPALFAVLPKEVPATLFGTSKLAGLFGSGTSALSYARRVRIAWSAVAPAAVAAFALSFAGAYTVTRVPSDFVRALLPVMLLFVAVYTFRNKDLGSSHAPLHSGDTERYVAVALGAGIGFYAGFFGPGAGSFLIFLFVRYFGFDFLNASAAAKVVNVACNISALMWLGYNGHILWQLGLVMAACQVAGSIVGTRIALRHGSAFVRKLFLVVVALLILKTGYDAFLM
ncbi:sulfite exporter TauE/SafE family protein [Massilia cavernae]|uniref:Probable membrane transporter protein n=1 Tax=Massilia cavernae TaxID=2320864 RepID=A0A418XTB5_9BURK|nr:TSUP family transporter [Massilia cavernae]RJG15916.1 sulfite exporter TauE/SafE family protein [Massilia cavernae]